MTDAVFTVLAPRAADLAALEAVVPLALAYPVNTVPEISAPDVAAVLGIDTLAFLTEV